MKLVIAISLSITFILLYGGMGAPVNKDDYWMCDPCETGDFEYGDTIVKGK